MLHTLRALRENNDLLMCILDVFIKEPSIDWIGSAARIGKQNRENEAVEYSAGVQYAKSRVNSVRKKLDGINPCVITLSDLESGIHKNSKYMKYFQEALLGMNVRDSDGKLILTRSKLLDEYGDDYRLTCEEQVRIVF